MTLSIVIDTVSGIFLLFTNQNNSNKWIIIIQLIN